MTISRETRKIIRDASRGGEKLPQEVKRAARPPFLYRTSLETQLLYYDNMETDLEQLKTFLEKWKNKIANGKMPKKMLRIKSTMSSSGLKINEGRAHVRRGFVTGAVTGIAYGSTSGSALATALTGTFGGIIGLVAGVISSTTMTARRQRALNAMKGLQAPVLGLELTQRQIEVNHLIIDNVIKELKKVQMEVAGQRSNVQEAIESRKLIREVSPNNKKRWRENKKGTRRVVREAQGLSHAFPEEKVLRVIKKAPSAIKKRLQRRPPR